MPPSITPSISHCPCCRYAPLLAWGLLYSALGVGPITHPEVVVVNLIPTVVSSIPPKGGLVGVARFPTPGPPGKNTAGAVYRAPTAEMMVILPQVHLRQPCYDFYLLEAAEFECLMRTT